MKVTKSTYKDGYQEAELTRIWGEFTTPEVELEFKESIQGGRLNMLRFFAAFGGLLLWLTIGADFLYLGFGEEFYTLAALRVAAGGVCFIAVLVVSAWRNDKVIDLTMFTAAVTVAAVICLVPYYRIEESQIHQLIAVMLLVLYYSFFPVRLNLQLLIGLFMTLFLLGVMFFAIEAKPFDITGVAILITLANGVGFFTSQRLNALLRNNYWKVILLNREVETNRVVFGQFAALHQEVERSNQQLRDAVDNISDGFTLFDKNQRLILCNDKFRKMYRFSEEETQFGTPRSQLLELSRFRNAISNDTPEKDRNLMFARLSTNYPVDTDAVFKLYDGRWIQVRERRTPVGNIVALNTDITKLHMALEEINTLKGILPICTNCKKIRDDSGYWEMLEAYIAKHSELLFSHSICPTCVQELYGKEGWYSNARA